MTRTSAESYVLDMSAADLTPFAVGTSVSVGGEFEAAPRAVVRLLRSGRVTAAQRERIRALYPELYASFDALPKTHVS
ncbi:MAG: hypothetical protein IPJ34_14795 [Myxococcales bacterium]|nr:hypothetical protein [Myxococcales bacterium]